MEEIYENEEKNKYQFSKITANRLVELCQEEYSKEWFPRLDQLVRCKKQKSWLRRLRRFVPFLVIGVIFAISVITAIVSTSVVLIQSINTLNSSLTEARDELHEVRAKLATQKQINDGTLQGLHRVFKDMGQMNLAIEKFALNIADAVKIYGTSCYCSRTLRQ